jgi:hypothetical protein
MADFLDRKALKKLFDAANSVRRRENGTSDRAVVYLLRAARGAKADALKTIHQAAIEEFGGKVGTQRPDGLAGVFERPLDALRAALHANHASDLAREMLSLPACRVAITMGIVKPACDRAARIAAYAGPYEAIFEAAILKADLSGYHDIMANAPRRVKVAGIGTLSLVSVRPLGLRPELDDELEEVDSELRSGTRRTKK